MSRLSAQKAKWGHVALRPVQTRANLLYLKAGMNGNWRANCRPFNQIFFSVQRWIYSFNILYVLPQYVKMLDASWKNPEESDLTDATKYFPH